MSEGAPFVCEKCCGDGGILFDAYGEEHAQWITCPICQGARLIWPDGTDALREEVRKLKAKPNRKSQRHHGGGPKKGSMQERLICTVCGELVAMNWASRHAKAHLAS